MTSIPSTVAFWEALFDAIVNSQFFSQAQKVGFDLLFVTGLIMIIYLLFKFFMGSFRGTADILRNFVAVLILMGIGPTIMKITDRFTSEVYISLTEYAKQSTQGKYDSLSQMAMDFRKKYLSVMKEKYIEILKEENEKKKTAKKLLFSTMFVPFTGLTLDEASKILSLSWAGIDSTFSRAGESGTGVLLNLVEKLGGLDLIQAILVIIAQVLKLLLIVTFPFLIPFAVIPTFSRMASHWIKFYFAANAWLVLLAGILMLNTYFARVSSAKIQDALISPVNIASSYVKAEKELEELVKENKDLLEAIEQAPSGALKVYSSLMHDGAKFSRILTVYRIALIVLLFLSPIIATLMFGFPAGDAFTSAFLISAYGMKKAASIATKTASTIGAAGFGAVIGATGAGAGARAVLGGSGVLSKTAETLSSKGVSFSKSFSSSGEVTRALREGEMIGGGGGAFGLLKGETVIRSSREGASFSKTSHRGSSEQERTQVSRALDLIGGQRGSEEIIRTSEAYGALMGAARAVGGLPARVAAQWEGGFRYGRGYAQDKVAEAMLKDHFSSSGSEPPSGGGTGPKTAPPSSGGGPTGASGGAGAPEKVNLFNDAEFARRNSSPAGQPAVPTTAGGPPSGAGFSGGGNREPIPSSPAPVSPPAGAGSAPSSGGVKSQPPAQAPAPSRTESFYPAGAGIPSNPTPSTGPTPASSAAPAGTAPPTGPGPAGASAPPSGMPSAGSGPSGTQTTTPPVYYRVRSLEDLDETLNKVKEEEKNPFFRHETPRKDRE